MPTRKATGLAKSLTQQTSSDARQLQVAGAPVTAPAVEIEISQTVIVNKIDSLVQAWCQGCGLEGQWVTPEHAAIISNVDTRAIYRRVENGTVHFMEPADGPALVCLSSLFA